MPEITAIRLAKKLGAGFDDEAFQAWLQSRPECVQKLVKEFLPGTMIYIDGVCHYVISYSEGDDMLGITQVNPEQDYELAAARMRHICAQHVREFMENEEVVNDEAV